MHSDNYIGSNGNTNNPNLGFSYFPSLTLNLNAECRKYTVVLFTQSITNNTKINVSGPTGSFFLVPELIAPDFDITYLAVDSFSHIIKAIHPSADFKGLIPGSYKIYGVYYYAGFASISQN